MYMILAIGLGGALGALLRYFITSMIFNQLGNQFPWGTLTVNLLGCALLGFLITIFSYSWSSSEEIRSFFNIGLIGALTTFSAFSIEVVLMIEKGNWLMAASYVVLSVICCVGVTMVSMFVTKTIIS
ncbi:MAG: fluoride efflux transporter CrcB [Rhodospirillales bacterium]|nr:fluoride efflux transporter CrcB [Rhodospirillales bacterium]